MPEDLWRWVQASDEQAVTRPDGATTIRGPGGSRRRPSVPVPPIHAIQFATGMTACGRRSPGCIWCDWPPEDEHDCCRRCLRALRRR